MAKFNFLEKIENIENMPVYQYLNKYGNELCDYAKDYFSYVVTYTADENKIIMYISLYILIPEIKMEYNIITVDMTNISQNKIKSTFKTLITQQTEVDNIDISKGYEDFDSRMNELLSTQLVNQSFKFLVDQVDMKRENTIKFA